MSSVGSIKKAAEIGNAQVFLVWLLDLLLERLSIARGWSVGYRKIVAFGLVSWGALSSERNWRKMCQGLLPGQGQNLAMHVLSVPYSLSSGVDLWREYC